MKIVSISHKLLGFFNLNDFFIEKVQFKELNLLVGKNATGKSRLIQLISSLSDMIAQKTTTVFLGDWEIVFETQSKASLYYSLTIDSIKGITNEQIKLNNKILLERNGDTRIYSYKSDSYLTINPPDNKLVLHVRRDKEEFPYLEEIVAWAENIHGFKFGNISPLYYLIDKEKDRLTSVDNIPSLLEKMLGLEEKQIHLDNIISDFNSLGYDLEDIQINRNNGQQTFLIKEKNLEQYIEQNTLSQGMFRSLALIVFFEYLLTKKEVSTVLIDDLCEGLDYERASKLGKLLFTKYAQKNIQLIVTTNDSFLMDSVNIKNWNVLTRENNVVKAYNYENSKELFEKFKYTGLSNFDFFSSDYLMRDDA